MSLAFDHSAYFHRAVAVVRAGSIARDLCRRAGRGEVAAVFEHSCYLRIGEDFICIGEPAIGNGPSVLTVAARVATLGIRQGQPVVISGHGFAIGDVLFDLSACRTWRTPPWPPASSATALLAARTDIARRAATESPTDSVARAAFSDDDTPLARLARLRMAQFETWLWKQIDASSLPAKAGDVGWPKRRRRVPTISDSGGHGASRLSPPYGTPVSQLVGLGPGLTPSGDDFLIGALAALDALGRTDMHARLGRAVLGAAACTSPLSASFLRVAAAGHVGENLHAMVAALIGGNAKAAIAEAQRIGHTSGWDALTGAAVTVRNL